jgi:hypothetical protein
MNTQSHDSPYSITDAAKENKNANKVIGYRVGPKGVEPEGRKEGQCLTEGIKLTGSVITGQTFSVYISFGNFEFDEKPQGI